MDLLMILDIAPDPVRTGGAGFLLLLSTALLAIIGVLILASVLLFIKTKRQNSRNDKTRAKQME